MEANNIGCIKRLPLPAGWELTKEALGQFGNSFLYNYAPANVPNLQLSLFYRGMNIPTVSGSSFLRVLRKEPHQLSSETILTVTDVLGNVGQPDLYDLEKANTIELSSRMVLDVRGIFPEFELANRTIFINGGAYGCAVMEIIFSSPKPIYAKNEAYIDECLQKIEWNETDI
jgi:hypothetical protein